MESYKPEKNEDNEMSTLRQDDRIEINNKLDEQAIETGEKFIAEHLNKLDLGSENLESDIEAIYREFQSMKIGDQAADTRKFYFQNEVSTYGVVYGSDFCISQCAFCPAGHDGYKHKSLSADDIATDTLATLAQGHTEVCYLQADVKEDGFLKKAEKWLPKTLEDCGNNGLKTLVLNIQTLSKEGYEKIVEIRDQVHKKTGEYVEISIRTFQETYNEETYRNNITDRGTGGEKYKFDRRASTQETAIEAGVDSVGFGVLIGLHNNVAEELMSLATHVKSLENKGVKIGRIALPAAHAVKGFNLDIPFDIPIYKKNSVDELELNQTYVKLIEMIYSTARLLMPHNSIVMSERDPQELLEKLAQFADHTTVGVHPSVGGNIEALLDKELKSKSAEEIKETLEKTKSHFAKKVISHILETAKQKDRKEIKVEVEEGFSQATVTSKTPEVFAQNMKNLGLNLELSRDNDRLEKITNTLSEKIGFKVTETNF